MSAADEFRVPDPHDIGAEQAVLGSMMLSAAAAQRCTSALSERDFYRPAHGVIFTVIARMARDGEAVDWLTVKDRLESAGDLARCGGPLYLNDLLHAVPAAVNADHYARIVRDRSVRRALMAAGRRILQMADPQSGEEPHGLAERAVREAEAVRDSGLDDALTARTIREFLDAGESDDYDWIIPGLLERGDRLVITGMEGAGKSSLLRQLAVTTAAGIHPFRHLPIEPRRVLMLDCENSDRHTRRKIRPLVTQAALQQHPVAEANLWVECRPEGMDLALDKDVSALLRQVSVLRPDVVILGPLYRLAPRALNNDDDAAPVIAALNMIRARGACVILEAHAGHAMGPGGRRDMRPRGSSAFLGWPEFGYGLRWSDDPQGKKPGSRVVDFGSWRGDRDERDWPEMLAAGGVWPWKTAIPTRDPAKDQAWSAA